MRVHLADSELSVRNGQTDASLPEIGHTMYGRSEKEFAKKEDLMNNLLDQNYEF